MRIEQTTAPTTADIDFLTEKINQETPSYGEAFPFGFFIRDENGDIIGGCNGSVVYGSIYTDQLWVHPDYRGQGLGRQLMEKVHAYGHEIGCTTATVSTMDFQQAQTFYESIGYKKDFERPGYVHDARLILLQKHL
jgi:GNAT superfamily N-acetyltransferase